MISQKYTCCRVSRASRDELYKGRYRNMWLERDQPIVDIGKNGELPVGTDSYEPGDITDKNDGDIRAKVAHFKYKMVNMFTLVNLKSVISLTGYGTKYQHLAKGL